MRTSKRKQPKISIDRWIILLSGALAVIGWGLWIANIVMDMRKESQEKEINHPPVIQDGIGISRPMVSAGDKVPVRVIVNDPDEGDETKYWWEAQLGRIGEQLDRFQSSEVVYFAPDLPGTDIISVTVWDRAGEIDKDFYIITIVEDEGLGSP